MKKEESISREVGINSGDKSDSGAHAGNKVLPITEPPSSLSSSSSAKSNDEQCGAAETNNKKKPISRMKELIRWAATSAKTEKGGKLINGRKVSMFRRRGTLKQVPDDDQVCNDSPKISFRWDVESCSTSSTYSAISIASSAKNLQAQIASHSIRSIAPSETGSFTCREENWITTDSEYVVLEL